MKKLRQLSYKTTSANKETAKQSWLLVDAENQVLGRMASRVAMLVRGKHKTSYTPHINCGDHVVVINAGKVRLTGNKMENKIYTRYTGYPGGQRFVTAETMQETHPERMVERAIKKMLPRTRLGSDMFRNLHVYASAQHPHDAQQPKAVKL